MGSGCGMGFKPVTNFFQFERALKTFKMRILFYEIVLKPFYLRPIEILEVPKNKQNILDNDIGVSICGYGIYPDLPGLEAISTGIRGVFPDLPGLKTVSTGVL